MLSERFEIYFSGFALSITPGKLGELLKSQFLKKEFDVPRNITMPLILVEKIYHLFGIIIISSFGIIYFELSSFIILISIIILVSIIVLISSKTLFYKFFNQCNKIKFISKYSDSLIESYEVVQKSMRGMILVKGIILSVLFWLFESIIVALILYSFGINSIEFLKIILTYSSSILLGSASLLPEGIGVVEGTLTGIFTLYGIESSIAFTLVILIRIFTLWSSVVFGFISLKLSGVLSMNK